MGSAAHIEAGHVLLVVHQLKQVPIPAEDAHPPVLLHSLPGHGGNHVVGLKAGGRAYGEPQGLLEQVLQVMHVLMELLRRISTVGLVGGIQVVAKGGLPGIKGDDHPLGLPLLGSLQQRLEETVGHAGGDAAAGAQSPVALPQCVVAAKRQGMAIHQKQKWCVSHGRDNRAGPQACHGLCSAHGERRHPGDAG